MSSKKQLQIEKDKRINAERREKYTKEKYLLETKDFEKSDHADFKVMFDNIDENLLNPDMKIFWQVQHILQTQILKATDGTQSKYCIWLTIQPNTATALNKLEHCISSCKMKCVSEHKNVWCCGSNLPQTHC